jgi:signal recognition particle subunit SRP14
VGCLVRAVCGTKKLSCMITAKEHRRFMQSYGNILKVSLDSLKKREKKKGDKKAGTSSGKGIAIS